MKLSVMTRVLVLYNGSAKHGNWLTSDDHSQTINNTFDKITTDLCTKFDAQWNTHIRFGRERSVQFTGRLKLQRYEEPIIGRSSGVTPIGQGFTNAMGPGGLGAPKW